ncbi:hypothetical protein INT45_006394 [Circinella minor]|uniref:NAD(P)-binding domain-containing protein n=1 Tax=Circinella minor TaxID=1195481 RepID=A0A8H7VPW9_9FUNG|nr:hypothetical protein INT45_006394 [Circinella minor]
MVYEERIFLVGATGNIGKPLVQKLLTNPKVALTLYARTPAKVQELYGDQSEGKLEVVQGGYDNQKPFKDSIAGHTRLFLLIQTPGFQEGHIHNVRNFAETAYAAGVQQIVLISGFCSSMPWRNNIVANLGYSWESGIDSIPNRKNFVTLRPAFFMSNQALGDALSVKNYNKIIDSQEIDSFKPWISPDDIGELAANILQDPIEKHGDAVYEMVGDPRTPKEHVEILSRVLGREIVYEKVSEEQSYEIMTKQAGMSHLVAYTFVFLTAQLANERATPGLSILLGRQPETLEQWIEKNKSIFL